MSRISKDMYYMDIAKSVSKRGTCLRRNYGAVIIKDDIIISTGYTGSPRGCENCIDTRKCLREQFNIASGTRYELCNSVHAEMNAIISANRNDMIDSTIYIYGSNYIDDKPVYSYPCMICAKMIINSGIKNVVIISDDENLVKLNICDLKKYIELTMSKMASEIK